MYRRPILRHPLNSNNALPVFFGDQGNRKRKSHLLPGTIEVSLRTFGERQRGIGNPEFGKLRKKRWMQLWCVVEPLLYTFALTLLAEWRGVVVLRNYHNKQNMNYCFNSYNNMS